MKLKKLKKKVALEVLKFIPKNIIIGVGTGSTISYFIDFLKTIRNKIIGAVSSSIKTTENLKKNGIKIFELNKINNLPLYIDSADEINRNMDMIKGGGAALTKEKIIASAAKKFICIIDETKEVKILGKFPLPVEVLPMSYKYVKKKLEKLGGIVKKRNKIITENNNYILDISNLYINNPFDLENKINNIPGVISVGIFSQRKPDVLLVSKINKVKVIFRKNEK
ncbi:MAG: ribose-5-phosphate isomerase RpiA [Buchnera aphidicola (Periphyllus lyropictus)]|uniref:ribose-5-phosphate isomerase RpiA n=1 Tax=Buchnera aphidicola TaxID=9 RepID=UPI001EC87E34|nr:ribose-5-phosphate isomerase RpiA [Buchnera aphidicola]NIH16552.1 ribose-5-phosphate isomerase RpiA [Buchnera aphidicola (Periphyllus lyropictus)]USS94445.1 ribose-5-phosphate isomerase RpiA [Buchnera aphidicola (Periphyllus lyropictus)]